MRKYIFPALAIVLVLGYFLGSCKKSDDSLPNQDPKIITTKVAPAGGCDAELLAGQHIHVGWVTTSFEGDILTITYMLDEPGWYLKATHLDVQYVFGNIPMTRKFKPKVGLFQFKKTFNPAKEIVEWTEVVDLTKLEIDDYMQSPKIYIAAHAEVTGNGNEGAWAGDRLFYKSWARYFYCTP